MASKRNSQLFKILLERFQIPPCAGGGKANERKGGCVCARERVGSGRAREGGREREREAVYVCLCSVEERSQEARVPNERSQGGLKRDNAKTGEGGGGGVLQWGSC